MKDIELLSKKDAASFLKISLRALDRMIMCKQITYYKLGDSKRSPVRFVQSDLLKWIQKFKNEAHSA
jgi:hypothetical protein